VSPQLLIARERLRPEMAAEYDRNERDIARASAALGCPHPYLALMSEDGREVWWLNLFASAAERELVAAAYAENKPFAAALQSLGAAKDRFRESLVMTLTDFQPELSGGQTLQLAGVRFVAVRITRDQPAGGTPVFASEDGEQFVIATAADRRGVESRALQLGHGSLILAVQPQWSFPDADWVAADPSFWKIN
jgi:hypothetical protein